MLKLLKNISNQGFIQKKVCTFVPKITDRMKNTTSAILFELLNRSLAPDRNIPTGEYSNAIGTPDRKTWLSLISLAEQNEVSGLIYDAVLTLPKEQQPDLEIMMRWTASVQSIERDNRLFRQHLSEVFDQFESKNLTPILMKGLTLSSLYPNPLHRPIGDVDLFVPIDRLHQIALCLQSIGGEIDSLYDVKHTTAQCNGLHWELHNQSAFFYSQSLNKRFRIFEFEETSPENLLHTQIEGHRVQYFPPLFNIIYLTAHFQHHLLMERISMRQVVDWALALHHERIALGIAENNLICTLKHLGLYRLYKALGYIAIHRLGYSACGYAGLTKLSSSDRINARLLLRTLLTGHVPGCRAFVPHLTSDNTYQRIVHFFELCKRCFILFRLSPQEAFATPFGFLRQAFIRQHSKGTKGSQFLR